MDRKILQNWLFQNYIDNNDREINSQENIGENVKTFPQDISIK